VRDSDTFSARGLRRSVAEAMERKRQGYGGQRVQGLKGGKDNIYVGRSFDFVIINREKLK